MTDVDDRYRSDRDPLDTHGSPELDEDARKLRSLGADPGATFRDLHAPSRTRPTLATLLKEVPPKEHDLDDEISVAATIATQKLSEARRDAILAVSLAIRRRGQNPLSDWTTRDSDTAYAIADLLAALNAS